MKKSNWRAVEKTDKVWEVIIQIKRDLLLC